MDAMGTDSMGALRTEHDSMGEVQVPAQALWGAQTQRSHENFPIGIERMPHEIVSAFAQVKKAAARANKTLGCLDAQTCELICQAADEVLAGKWDAMFPLMVWQTGSGTQSNMNMNEVLANRVNQLAAEQGRILPNRVHPNDTINMSQSSNDTFPTAMHVAAVTMLHQRLLPVIDSFIATLHRLEQENYGIVKCGRTHLQDAVPIGFWQEIAGWRGLIEAARDEITASMTPLTYLALGGTAVGTGLNAPAGFDREVAAQLAELTGEPFKTDPNKFRALTGKDALVFSHGALKALAANVMKIANDVRWLASGPRLGLGEISIPENEPGSSIMPGKVNPTQCEAVTMVAVQVMGNDATLGFAASQGNFELNVFMPVMAYNYLQSVRLLADAIASFDVRCVSGIKAHTHRMDENLHRSLMLVTCLSPEIGYENAARVAHKAFEDGTDLKEACVALGYLTPERFDEVFDPRAMV